MSDTAILDTSWLLELYRVPRYFNRSRTSTVLANTAEFIETGGELFVTVPVLFEVASHITHVRDGRNRRALGQRLRDDIESSLDHESPWTITTVGSDILLRSTDVMHLADRFLESSGPNYSFADISIIDLATELRRVGKAVRKLAFDQQLASYSD
ncbi:MAG: hypothetical protein OXH52_04035 [Gammaproteobacteria bacterium]|nr:hypothetical protein [Gammaproteobacteria bacterium]